MVHPFSHLQLFLAFLKVLLGVLVIFYINDQMEQELMAGSVLHVYADDILLYVLHHSLHT